MWPCVLQVLAHFLDFLAHVIHLVVARLKVVVVIGQVNTDLILRIKECIEKTSRGSIASDAEKLAKPFAL